ncbi:hypothetical protein AUP68_04496 [Ilyonectria robusta]
MPSTTPSIDVEISVSSSVLDFRPPRTWILPRAETHTTTGIARQKGDDDESASVIGEQYSPGKLSVEELFEKLGQILRVWRRCGAGCFEDGEMYKIGIEEEGIATGWIPWGKDQFRAIPV